MNRVKIASILGILYFCVVVSYLAPAARMRQSSSGPSQMENLGRGVVAVRSTTTEVFVSWRVLGTDRTDTSFNLYRSTGGGSPTLLNAAPITGATDAPDVDMIVRENENYRSALDSLNSLMETEFGSFVTNQGSPGGSGSTAGGASSQSFASFL